jgi:predicted metalloprotease with PDZ domain
MTSWIGKAIHFESADYWFAETGKQEYWFTEGFTDFYSIVVCTRLGFISEDEFLINLKRSWESYLSEQGKLSIREAGKNKFANRELVYDGGSLIAMALDLQIRALTQNRNSLDDVIKQMYQEFGLTRNMFTVNDVIRVVSQIAGEDFEPFFSKYVTGTERLPLEEYLKNVGVDAQIEFGEKLPNLRYILNEMLSIRVLRNMKAGSLIIFRSPKYQDGDRLIAINDTPVKTFDDIRRLAKDWNSGDIVTLTLERDGKEIILPTTLGGMSGKPPHEAVSVNINITPKIDRTEAQRVIWTGILGHNQ